MRLFFSAALLALSAASASAQASAPRNELSAGAGILTGELTYARRLGSSPVSVGAGVWGAWEPPHTFDRDVLEPLGATLFARLRPAPWARADVGLTAARYLRADDCSECTGTFAGMRAVALVGHRWLFVGPEVAFGTAHDERHGSAFGAIWGLQARLVLGWGR
ncbi:MAG: hypothetical protein ICV87_04175 [Gemmatimonadetes bacterium]|nr:hypothetical protein [Gemmatimonadota bacterium]